MTTIAAVMMVRNEQSILATSVGHLLNFVGVDYLMIGDNGSTDATPKLLELIAQNEPRVRWTDVSGPWSPSPILTGFAREFYRKGVDWIIPCDADEFIWSRRHTIRELCSSKMIGGFVFNLRNFVQWSWIKKEHPWAVETMILSTSPIGTQADAQKLVEDEEIAFVQMV